MASSNHLTDTPPTATAEKTTPSPLGTRAARGVLWTTAQKWVQRGSSLVTLAILARLLTPEDFGVVAVAATVAALLSLMADVGFGTYIVQTRVVDQRLLSTGLWLSVSAGVGLALAAWLGSPLVAAAFGDPGVAEVVRIMCLAAIITGASGVPIALLRRDLRFRELALQSLVAAGVSQVVAIIAAFSGAGVWALVAQFMTLHLIVGGLAWRSARWLPSLEFSRSAARSLASFGVRVLGADVVGMARVLAETAIVAQVLGMAALGYLNIAQRLVLAAQELSAAALLPVSVATFSKVPQQRLNGAYRHAAALTYVAASPLLIFAAVCAPVLIPLAVGDSWAASVPIAVPLCFAAILTLGASLDHGFFYGIGKPGTWLRYALVIDLLTVATTAVLATQGLDAVAYGFLAVAGIATVARWWLVARSLEVETGDVVRNAVRPLAVIAVTAAAGAAWQAAVAEAHAAIVLVSTAACVLLVHAIACRILVPATLRHALVVINVPDRIATPLRRVGRLPDQPPAAAT